MSVRPSQKCWSGALQRKDEEIKRNEERIAYLKRIPFGAKGDKLASQGPTLFDSLFDEVMDECNKVIAETAKEIQSNYIADGDLNLAYPFYFPSFSIFKYFVDILIPIFYTGM